MKFLDKIEEYIMIIAFPLMVTFVTLSTTFRYFKLGSIPWAEEASRYLMILMAFAGISLGFKNNSHIGMSFIVDKMPHKIRRWLILLRNILIIGFGLLTSYFTFIIIQSQLKFIQKSPSMGIPMWCVYMTMLWGSIMIVIRATQAVINKKEENQEVL